MALPILLLGAGFTKNWGGLLAKDFVGQLCGRLIDRPQLNEKLRVDNNFERVLGECRSVAKREPDNVNATEDVARLEAAILAVFRDINLVLADRGTNLTQDGRWSTRRFLSRFEAIFSLNQDLFFELHYDHMNLESDGRWSGGGVFPGVILTHDWTNPRFKKDRVEMTLRVKDEPERPARGNQPVYKLHGSVNWRTADQRQVLVVGTGKEAIIDGSPLLRRYQEIFRDYLFRQGTEIMVLGYGFADAYINALLLEAARNYALRMYLINPADTRAYSAHGGLSASGRNELLEIPLLGVCADTLQGILQNDDSVEIRGLERFFRMARM